MLQSGQSLQLSLDKKMEGKEEIYFFDARTIDVFAAIPKERGKMPFEDEESETFILPVCQCYGHEPVLLPWLLPAVVVAVVVVVCVFVRRGWGERNRLGVHIQSLLVQAPLERLGKSRVSEYLQNNYIPFYASYMIAQLLVPLGFKGGLATPASSSSATPKTESS